MSGSRIRLLLLLLIVLAVAAFLVVGGILPRLRARQTLVQQTRITAEPAVILIRAKREKAGEDVVLPGSIQAFVDAPIYARTNGYLKRWFFDIGAHVKQGQVLAIIESPEVDRQLQQAKEDLKTAEANLKLSQITAERYTDLLKSDSVSKQEVDNAVQDAAAKSTTVQASQANVQRMEQMVAFEQVAAPFDGVVTARNTDVGQLIDSGSSAGASRELFHVAAVNKLRVFVNVPQLYSHVPIPGMKAALTFPELPGRRFTGTLVRTADSFDPATRTLLTEVDVANSTGQLFPGSYAEVNLNVKSNRSTLIVPSTSLIFRAEGMRIPVLVNGNRAHLLAVTLGRDFGNTVEVTAGLDDDANIIANPPDSLVDGEVVRVMPADASASPK